MGGGPKPNSNVPIVDVPKWLRRGGVRPNWDNVLKYGFFFFEGIPKLEPMLAKSSGYHTKLIEKSGKPLSNMFSKPISIPKCHREYCAPCGNEEVVGSLLCQSKSVIYESVCV